MPTALAPLARQLEERAQHDAGFADILDVLLKASTRPDGHLERVAARKLNRQRRDATVHDFTTDALPTSRAQALLRLGTPQAVHGLRSRGKLLGSTVGNQTWFPAWQFDTDRLRPDLPRILALLDRFTSDPYAADRIMRLTREELGGESIAEALRETKNAGTAWRILAAVGA